MPNQKNVDQVKEITEQLNKSKAVYLVDYQGLGVNDFNQLRNQIREVGGQMVVVKNTLFNRALQAADKEAEVKIHSTVSGQIAEQHIDLNGATAALYATEDQLQPLKVVVKYAKAHDELPTLKLGLLNGRLLNTEEVSRLADLPGQDQLRAQVVGMLAGPLSRLVGSLQSNLRGIAIVLNEIRKSKDSH